MSNGNAKYPDPLKIAGIKTDTPTRSVDPLKIAGIQIDTPTRSVDPLKIAGINTDLLSTAPIRRDMPTFTEAFFGSLGEELTFGKLYNDPRLDADDLSGAAKAGKMLGAGAAFFGVTAMATVATGGLGGLAMLGTTASRLSQGAKVYNAAKKAGDVAKMSEGIATAGIGVKNSKLLTALGKNGVQKSYIDKFMKLAEKDVSAARQFVLRREMGREALIFGSTGQMLQEDDATFKQRAVAFGQDAVAGALFAVAPAFKFANNPYIKSLGKSKSAELGSYFMSGFVSSLPNEEGQDLGSRLFAGAVTTGIGRLFGGATMTASKGDVRNALERIGLTDEKQLSEYSQIAMGVVKKQGVKTVDEQYKTIDFSSFDKKTGEVKTTAKVRKVYVEPQDGKLKVEYQTYYKNGEPKDLVTRDFKDFNQNYKKSDNNLIQQIKYNLDKKGEKFSFFEDQDDLQNFLNRNKFGVVTANNPKYFANKAIGIYGETPNEVLIRELLSRGYKRSQIMATENLKNRVSEGRSFLVKNLKEKDSVELAKIFGQESITTHKGFLNVKRATRKVQKTKDGKPVLDKEGNIAYEDVGFKVGKEKTEITDVSYNLKSQNARIKDTTYRGSHQPRGPEDDLPVRLDNLTRSTTGERVGYPDDFYGPMGQRYYAPGERKFTLDSLFTIKNRYKKQGIELDISETADEISLSRIVVPVKGKGVGSSVMEDLRKYADSNNKTITLTPTKDFGATSVSRLKKFYKKFDFVENTGSNKNFKYKDTMYRKPQPDLYGRANNESYQFARIYRNKPNATVTVYRAVPKGINSINRGDFVTLSPTYAKLHAENNLGPNVGKVLSKRVKAKEVFWAQDDVNEFGYFPDFKKNIYFGKEAQKKNEFINMQSKNGDTLSFSYEVDFRNDVMLKNPTMNREQQLVNADEILMQSARKVSGEQGKFQIYKDIKALEKEAGLRAKSPLDNRHEALKVNVFGKKSLTQMNDDELKQYKALIDNQPSYTTRIHEENGGILFDMNPSITEMDKMVNKVLPISTKFGNLGKKLNSPTLKKVEKDLTQMVREREEIKGTYRLARDEMKERYKFYDLTKEEQSLLDKELIYHIDDRFKDLRSDLSPKQKAALQDIIGTKEDQKGGIHYRLVNDIFKRMQKANVQEKVFNGKGFDPKPIQKVKNFVSLTISDEAAELLSKQDIPLRDSMVDNILKTDKRFKRGGEFFSAPNKYKMAEKILDETLSHSAKHGIYGAQYSRTAKLPPRIFLDDKGAIIPGVDNMKLKVGDDYNGLKIGKVINTYIEDYGLSMDRYAGRAASITAASKYFGPEGIVKKGKFTEKFNVEVIRPMEKEVRVNTDIEYVKKQLEKDLDLVLRGDDFDDILSPPLRALTSWTASLGLSSPRSALKNLLLGQVQNVTTFGVKKYTTAMFKIMTDEKFYDAVYRRATKVGALDAGQQLVETVGVARTGEGVTGAVQRGLTKGMQVAEQRNRLYAVASSQVAADDALKALADKTDNVLVKLKKPEARRLLEDVFQVDGWEEAVKRGSFTEDQLSQIYFRGHTLTQGLADPSALPRFMSTSYAKPFTLFYRIAYRITENVYQNAYKPLVQNGEFGPMLRYVAASAGAGAAIQNLYYLVHNADKDKFVSAPEEFWNYFVAGEGMGIFSALTDTNRPVAQTITPAIVQTGLNLYGATSLVARGAFLSETTGERDVLLKEARESALKSVPVANDIINGIRKRTDKKTETRFRQFRQKQGAYKSDILNKNSGNYNFSPATTQSLMYKQITANLYSDRSLEEKNKDFWAAVTFIQHQKEMADTNVISKRNAFKYAYDKALEYVEDSEPINLSKKRTQGKKISDYDDFVARLNPKELSELKELEAVHKKKLRELKQYIRTQKNKYRP